MIKTMDLYDLSHTMAGEYLKKFEYPWQALSGIKNLILELGSKLDDNYDEVSPNVWVHKTATVISRPLSKRLRRLDSLGSTQ